MADTTRRKPAARQPITSHPLFPAVVVLWFGALFGLVSIAIRPALIERVVDLTAIDTFIPMAAPPLGTTTRILLALLMTALGCLVGALVARLVVTSRSAPGARRRRVVSEAEAESGSPVALFGSQPNAEDEQEAEGDLASHQVLARQLAPAAEDDEIEDAPSLRTGPQVLNVADLGPDLDLNGHEDAWVSPFRRTEANVSGRFEPEGVTGDVSAETSVSSTGLLQFPVAGDASEAEQPDEKRNRLFEAYAGAKRVRPDLNDASTEKSALAPGFASLVQNALDAEGSSNPQAVRRAAAMHEDSTHAQFDAGSLKASTRSSNEFRLPSRSTAAERIASAPLEELSHVELLERLALALERRRTAYAQLAEVAPRHAAPFGFDAAEEEEAEHEDERVGGYSSLLDLSMRMVSRPLVQSEGFDGMEVPEPVVMFPAHQATCVPENESSSHPAAAGPRSFDAPRPAEQEADETERALQDALAKLQRMSGAA